MAQGQNRSEHTHGLLFLTDEQLRKGIEAMFFAYRGFTADPDRILAEKSYGRAHHRALHFIQRSPGTTVNNLLSTLGVTKAYRQAGAEAVYGFCTVLEAMMDPDLKKHYDQLTSGETV